MQLHEKYRPQSFDCVVGQSKAINTIKHISERYGLGGRAFWISGKSGTGKTTIARLIAKEIADDWFVAEMDAGPLSVSDLIQMGKDMQLVDYHMIIATHRKVLTKIKG